MVVATSNTIDYPKNLGKALEVNVVQSTLADKSSKGKKKGKGKSKQDIPKHDSPKMLADDTFK